jgi:outer membrane protein
MRFIIVLLMAIGLGAPVAAAQDAQQGGFPIGIVDYNQVLGGSSAGRSMQEQLNQIRTQMIQGIQTEEQAIQREAQSLAQQAQGQTRDQLLTNTTLTGQIAANDRRAQALRQRADADARDLAYTEQMALQQFNQALNPILAEVMQQRGIALLLDRSAVVQAAAQLDVTEDILTRFNQRVPSLSVQRQTAPAAPAQ